MRYVYRKSNDPIQKFEETRNRLLRKRSLNKRSSNLQDQQVSKSVPSSSEQRCSFFLVPFDLQPYWRSCPLPPLLEFDQSEQRISGATPEMEVVEALCPQLQPVGEVLQGDKNNGVLEENDSSKSSSYCRSSGVSILKQPENDRKRADPATTMLSMYIPFAVPLNKSCNAVSDGSKVSSDFLVDCLPKADNSPKRNSRKKGKKKGKQSKRGAHRKGRVQTEIPDNNDLTRKLSEDDPPSSSSTKENSVEKEDSDDSHNYVDCSSTLASSTSCSDEMDDSVSSAPYDVTYTRDSCNGANHLVSETHSEPKSNSCRESSRDILCTPNEIATETSLDGWNSDVSANCIGESYLGNSCQTRENLDRHDDIERGLYSSGACSNEACSINDFCPVTYGRKGRRWRNISKFTNSDGYSRIPGSNTGSAAGKDSGLPVSLKVQKSEKGKRFCTPRNGHGTCVPDKVLTEETKTRSCGYPKPNQEGITTKSSWLAKSKKPNSPLEHTIHQCRRGRYMSNNNILSAPKERLKRDDLVEFPFQDRSKLKGNDVSVSSPRTHTKESDFVDHELKDETVTTPNYMENMTAVHGNMVNDGKAENSSANSDVDEIRGCLRAKPAHVSYKNGQNIHAGTLLACSDARKNLGQGNGNISSETTGLNSTGFSSKKWVPSVEIGKFSLDMVLPESLRKSSMLGSLVDGDATRSGNSGTLNSNAACFVPSNGRNIPKLVEHRCLKEEDINSVSGEFSDASRFQLEINLEKIQNSIINSYRVERMVENSQKGNGNLASNLERFIHSASPVISSAPVMNCNYCKQEIASDDMLCCHQISNISLKSIWEWYEEPGCYGLEVKLCEHHNPEKQCNRSSGFSAYFVPYLSALQLYSPSKKTRQDQSKVLAVNKISNTSCALEESCFEGAEGELIFEYFESEQPPRRYPLYDKIKELTSGVKPFNSQIFGDPQMLECLNLSDIHPASWYSVAWYPICRIPDGNFRAAFLTHHSFGCAVCRSEVSNKANASIVSPVVGLQAYNAKSELWFQRTDVYSDVAVVSPNNPSVNLQDRLKSLNQTASTMSRAKITKGGQSCTNVHPDYEFFLSRG